MITLHPSYVERAHANNQKNAAQTQAAATTTPFQSVLNDLLNEPLAPAAHTGQNPGILQTLQNTTPLSTGYDLRYDSLQRDARQGLQIGGTRGITTQYQGWTPRNPIERTQLWNRIAMEHPEALVTDVKDAGGYDSLREAQSADIRRKLRALGVDLTTAAIIASREVATTVRRPDGTVPGYGSSGYHTLPGSIRSSAVPGSNLAREGVGYAYVNRYGGTHVVHDLARALDFSADGKVYEFEGFFGGGHAYDNNFQARQLPLPGSRHENFGFSQRGNNRGSSTFVYRFRALTEMDIAELLRFS